MLRSGAYMLDGLFWEDRLSRSWDILLREPLLLFPREGGTDIDARREGKTEEETEELLTEELCRLARCSLSVRSRARGMLSWSSSDDPASSLFVIALSSCLGSNLCLPFGLRDESACLASREGGRGGRFLGLLTAGCAMKAK